MCFALPFYVQKRTTLFHCKEVTGWAVVYKLPFSCLYTFVSKPLNPKLKP